MQTGAGMPLDIDILTLLTLCGLAFLAGAIDAIVGGGGLVLVPGLLLVLPSQSPATLLGTNKAVAIFGTSMAAVNFGRRIPPTRKFAGPMVVAGLVGSMLGAFVATLIPASAFKPVVLIALAGVWIYTLCRKDFGELDQHNPHGRTARLVALGGGFGIGFYDGLIGPGTGAFLIMLLIAGVGASFLRASATAKLVNTATNLGALLVFAITGNVLWLLGLLLAVCNVAGAFVGSHLALVKGSRFVRVVFLVVVAALIVRLGFDVL